MRTILLVLFTVSLFLCSILSPFFIEYKSVSASGENTLSFMIISDYQNNADSSNPRAVGTANDIDDLTTFGYLDFVLDLGDITQDRIDSMDEYEDDWIDGIALPMLPVLGNHDVVDYHPDGTSSNPYRLLHRIINETDLVMPSWSMMKDGILFLAVGDYGRHYDIQRMQMEWLTYMLNTYSSTTTVILTHEPIRNTTDIQYDSVPHYRQRNNDTYWHDLIESNSQVKLVINGHNHLMSNTATSGDLHSGVTGHGMIHYANQDGADAVCVSVPYIKARDYSCFIQIDSSSITVKYWEYDTDSFYYSPSSYPISTTYDTGSSDWYSYPLFFEDNQTKTIPNKILSPSVTLSLIGQSETELFENSDLEYYSNELIDGSGVYYPYWCYFKYDNDISPSQMHGSNSLMYGKMRIESGDNISFPFVTTTGIEAWDPRLTHTHYSQGGIPSISGVHTFGGVPPNAEYTIKLYCRALTTSTTFTLNMSVTADDDVTSTLSSSQQTIFNNQAVGTSWGYIYGNYTQLSSISGDDNGGAEFLKTQLTNTGPYGMEILEWSIKRRTTGTYTTDFHVSISDVWYNDSGILGDGYKEDFSVTETTLSSGGEMVIHADIGGNKRGWIRLIYAAPALFSRCSTFDLNSINGNVYSVTAYDLSSYNNWCEFIPIFQDHSNLSVSSGSIITSTNGYYSYSQTSTGGTSITFSVTYGEPGGGGGSVIYNPSEIISMNYTESGNLTNQSVIVGSFTVNWTWDIDGTPSNHLIQIASDPGFSSILIGYNATHIPGSYMSYTFTNLTMSVNKRYIRIWSFYDD